MQVNQKHNEEIKKRFNERMNFDQEVMQFEIEKAERMLKRTDKLIEKAKTKSIANTLALLQNPHVKFILPDI